MTSSRASFLGGLLCGPVLLSTAWATDCIVETFASADLTFTSVTIDDVEAKDTYNGPVLTRVSRSVSGIQIFVDDTLDSYIEEGE